MSAATKPAPAARRKATTPQAQRSPGRRGRSATPAPTRPPGHVLRVVSKSGDARELDSEPIDHDTAVRRAERLARLVGRLVAPKLARGAVVVVIAVDSLREVERIAVKVPRRRKATEAEGPGATPAPQADKSVPWHLTEYRARYSALQQSEPNKQGHAILKTAQKLLAQLERFERKAHGGYAYKALKDAGYSEAGIWTDPSHMGLDDSYFDHLESDISGFLWSLQTFASLVESGLLLPPLVNTKGEKS